jgi:chromosome segregation ATPase
MAGPSKQELADIQIILDQIRKSYNDLGKSNPFSSNKAKDFVGQVHILRDALNQVNEELVDMDGEIGDLQDAWQSIVEEVNAYSNAQRQSKKEISNINELSQKLKSHQKGINTLSSEEIKKIGEKVSMSKEILSSNQSILEQQIRDLELKKQTQVLTTKENNELLNKKILVANINGMLTNQVGLLTNTEQKIEEQLQTQLKIEKSMGVMYGVLKGINRIPIIGRLVDTKDIIEKTEEKLKLLGPEAGDRKSVV